MGEQQTTPELAVGDKVWVHVNDPRYAPRLLTVEKVNPKTFVVDGERFSKADMTRREGSGWGARTVYAVRETDPHALVLAARRAALKAREGLQLAYKTFLEGGAKAADARVLATKAQAYAEAAERVAELEPVKVRWTE